MRDEPRLGSWVRARGLTGLVTRVDEEGVTVFAPGERQMATVPHAEVQAVPASAVHVRLEVDLPLPHGVGEESLRRWVASLVDPVLRERADEALRDARQDPGPALPEPDLTLTPAGGSDDAPQAVCLCGARTSVTGPQPIPCPACGREAVPPPGG